MFEDLIKNPYYREVVNFLREKKLWEYSYLVGGSVRDLILRRDVKDLDLAVKGDSLELARDFSKRTGGTYVPLDEVFSIGRVVKDNITIDFAKLSGESIEADLSERDFTINAMATDLSLKSLIDPFGGMEDLKNRLIRMVKEENLKADPLRILRAYRFHASFSFDIESSTRYALRKNAHLLKVTARERIKDELWKILSVYNSARTVEIMVEDEIFKSVLKMPHLLQIRPNLKALKIIEQLIGSPEKIFSHPKVTFNSNIIACLKFTGIFGYHSISLLRQIKPSKKEEKFVEKLIEAGDRIKNISTLLDKVRFVRDYENILYAALIYGTGIDPLGIARVWFYREIGTFYKKVYLKNKKKLPLIKGEDVLSMGFDPSALVGEIIERIETFVLAGKISNKKQAIEEIKNSYPLNIDSP